MKNKSKLEGTKIFDFKNRSCCYGDLEIIYDLEIPEQINMITDFLDALGKYCLNTINKNLLELVEQQKKLKASRILKAISFNGQVPFYSSEDDFDNFHNLVTRYLLESGWLTDFPAILLDVQGIDMLRLSIFRYILANWNWIVAIYNYEILKDLAESYGTISLKNSAIEEKPLRKEFIRKVLKQEIIELEKSLENRVLELTKNTEDDNFVLVEAYTPEDPIVRKAVEIALEKGTVSAPMLQVNLGKGVGFVTKLLIWFEKIGIISQADDDKPRKLLIKSMDDFDALTNNL